MSKEAIDRFPMDITIKSIEHSDPSHQGSMTAKSETARRSPSEPVSLDTSLQGASGGRVKCTVLASSPALSCCLSPGLGYLNEPIELPRKASRPRSRFHNYCNVTFVFFYCIMPRLFR